MQFSDSLLACIYMDKDFDSWNTIKKQLHGRHQVTLFRSREIWWCSLGVNVGVEADGKHESFERPILIVKKFNREMFWGVPLTSRVRLGPYYKQFSFNGTNNFAALSQARAMSAQRLIRRIGTLGEVTFDAIRRQTAELMTTDEIPEKETDLLRGPRVPNGN